MTHPKLFTPYQLGSITVRNRVWASPMCQYAVDRRDGIATDWHLVHLGSMASGGTGLVMAEATAVVPEGRISAWDLGLWSDEQIPALRRITDFLHSQGAVSAIQLAHAGRKASTYRTWTGERGSMPASEGGWQSVAPSAIAFEGLAEPRALAVEELFGVVAAFTAAAGRAVRAGFQVVELHAAHGYLLHQFLSPLSNQRQDAYGGSLEGRARLLREIVQAVVAEVSGRAEVMVRFSGTDWAAGGWDEQECATVAAWVVADGAAMVDISSGGLVHARIPTFPGYQVHLSDSVRSAAGVATSAVGLITDAAQAEQILQRGQADAIMLGRELLRDPHFANRAAAELGAAVDSIPVHYHRAPFPGPQD